MFKRKRVQAVVISFCMVMTLVSMPVFAQVTSGKCGETVSYLYDFSTNALTITGTGDMKQYSLTSPAPWDSFCEDIVSLNIESGVESIGSYAFYYCNGLINIKISESVTTIGEYAFLECVSLASVTISNSVTTISKGSFQNCTGLTNISVADGNSAYCSENDILYNKEKTEIICFPKNKSDNSFEIPDGITAIADGAFERCWNLTNVTIPNGVKTIGDDAFNYCRALTSITIPDGVTSIGNYTFFNCSSLTSVTIPNSVTSIGEYAFNKCNKLKNVNYIGSKEDWGTIDKGEDHSISDSIITYCKGIKAVQLNSGKIAVEPINTEKGKTVILALYNGDKFVDMQFGIYDGEEIQFETDKTYTRAKAMVWESLESMIPVCGAKTAE